MNVQGWIWPLIMARVLFHLYSLITVRNCYKYVWIYMVIELFFIFEFWGMLQSLYCWLLMIVDGECWDVWWLLQYWYMVYCWWLLMMIAEMSLLRIVVMYVCFSIDDWSIIDWVCISYVTLMIVDVCYFTSPILMMVSMFQHLYAGNADDDIALQLIWFLALTC